MSCLAMKAEEVGVGRGGGTGRGLQVGVGMRGHLSVLAGVFGESET